MTRPYSILHGLSHCLVAAALLSFLASLGSLVAFAHNTDHYDTARASVNTFLVCLAMSFGFMLISELIDLAIDIAQDIKRIADTTEKEV